MDSQTAIDDLENYPRLLREIGSLETLRGKPRRHVLTYADTWAPGEPRAVSLPATCKPGQWRAFRLHTGPKPGPGEVIAALGIEGGTAVDSEALEVRVNGELCAYLGSTALPKPKPDFPVCAFSVPLAAMHRGYNLIEVTTQKELKFGWVEFSLHPLRTA